TLADADRGVGQREVVVELGALRVLHAVLGQGTALRGEAHVLAGMPVTRGDDGHPGGARRLDPFVEHGNDLLASWHGERAAGTEVLLDIDAEQSIARLQFLGHGRFRVIRGNGQYYIRNPVDGGRTTPLKMPGCGAGALRRRGIMDMSSTALEGA